MSRSGSLAGVKVALWYSGRGKTSTLVLDPLEKWRPTRLKKDSKETFKIHKETFKIHKETFKKFCRSNVGSLRLNIGIAIL